MSSSSLRRTNIPGNGHRLETLSKQGSDDFLVTEVDQRSIQSLCNRYPFERQSAYSGTIRYQEQAEIGGGRNVELEFELRNQSGLFILESDVDIPSVESVIQRLNELAPDEFIIYRSLTVHRERLWEFLRGADQLIEATVVGKAGDKMELNELDLEHLGEIREYPIESATVAFHYEGDQIVTRYTDGRLSIHCDNPQAREYVIQLFERDILEAGG